MTKDKHKIYNNVFDNYTNKVINQLFSSHIIDEIVSPVSIGKEANVFTARKGEDVRILKIYRLQSCNFNEMYSYLISDPMYTNIKKNRRQIILSWVQREFSNMNKSHEKFINAPIPIYHKKHIILMSLIGNDRPAPMLKDKNPDDPKEFLEKIKKQIEKLLFEVKIVHGDLSAFNILNWDNEPYIIDFSQSTKINNPNWIELLRRDLKNIENYFSRKLSTEFDSKKYFKHLINNVERI